jgi:cell division protein FtsB
MADSTAQPDGLPGVDFQSGDSAHSTPPAADSGWQIEQAPRGGLFFWMLIIMGLATFTPCVLLPEWREYQALRMAEQREQHRLDGMRRIVERERQMVDAVQSDPAVIARLAQRDLRFYRPGETTVAVDVPAFTADEDPYLPREVELPRGVAAAGAYLPNFNYDAIFCDQRTRPIVMGMSVLLTLCACAIFWTRPHSESM